MKITIKSLIFIFAITLAAAAALPAKTSALTYFGPYLISNIKSEMCMSTTNSYATWTPIVQHTCNGNDQYQRFIYVDSGVLDQYGNHTYTIRPYHYPTQCVSVANMTADNGVPAILWPCQSTTNQYFRLFPMTQSDIFGLRALSSGKYLQVNGASLNEGAAISQWDYSFQDHYRWANSVI